MIPSMPYRYRFLPAEEYSRLAALPMGENSPSPEHSLIVVAEKGEEIVGGWGAFGTVAMDGLWVHPEHRKTLVAGKLAYTMLKELKSRGCPGVTTITERPDVVSQAQRLGFVIVPGTPLELRF